jgi:hypothetical protein
VSDTQEAQGLESPAGNTPPPEVTPTSGGGTPTKPRSGFARQKLKVKRLTELYENLLNDYEGLLADHDRLQAEHNKTLLDCAKLEVAFSEVTELNAALAGELRQLKQQHPAPVRYGTTNLMGM